MLEIGTKAPDFTLEDKNGKKVSLSDFLGKKIVLYFYPKDSTPGCTKQALGYADMYSEYKKLGVVVIGISKDSVVSHQRFSTRHKLPFIILSDTSLGTIKAYDVWHEKKIYGKVSMGVTRSTFIIDENGNVENIMPKVKAETNAIDILEYLKITM